MEFPAYHFFYPDVETTKKQGAYLPHWTQSGVIYFVTFRLADSLPQEKLALYRREKDAWLAANPEPHTPEQKADYHDRFPRRVQTWLDAGYGSLLLRDPSVARIVADAIRFFDAGRLAALEEGEKTPAPRYVLDAWVMAGNHAHVLIAPLPGWSLSSVMHSWKSYTAKEILKLPVSQRLTTVPRVWQKESWDHLVRSEESMERFRAYIRNHARVESS